MANVLKREKQIAVLQLLIEGCSIRSTERITGVHRDTVMRVMVRFGDACERFLDLSLSNLYMQHVQLDEIWTFVRKKQGKLKGREKQDQTIGDIYLFTALDTESKLIASYRLGKRTEATAGKFLADLRDRMIISADDKGENRPQISTDGWPCYPPKIAEAFGQTARHGVIIKNYVNPEVGRYAPPSLRRASRFNVEGIRRLGTICTSHMERWNLTARTFLRRFTRLSVGFSKKLENLSAAVSMHIANYNFCWRPREPGKSGKLTPTPSMAAGIVDTLWKFEDLYDNVMAFDSDQKTMAKYRRLAEKLQQKQGGAK